MTKEKFEKFHKNTREEANFLSGDRDSWCWITDIQSEKIGVDCFGNPSMETYSHISKLYEITFNQASQFFNLR